MGAEQPQILIVEDEKILAKDMENRLRRLGYTVPAPASSGEEAIQKAAQVRPDLVLMDIMLKGDMDGGRSPKSCATDSISRSST